MGEIRRFSIGDVTKVELQSGGCRYGDPSYLAFTVDDDSVKEGCVYIRIDPSFLLELFQKHSYEFIARKKSQYYYVTEIC
jgi:hypothetical protein